MTTHTITLARHTAQVVGLMGVLVLGTWDSYGTEQLLLRHGPEWEGLAIDATFHNVPNDEGVTVLADTDGLVTVPPEACKQPSIAIQQIIANSRRNGTSLHSPAE